MSLFKKPSELKTKATIKALIYGQPGLGKSTLALSAPRPVLLDFDGGVQRVNSFFQCPTLQVENWEQVDEALNEDLSSFDSIVIDTAGKMLDFMAVYIMKTDSKMKKRDGSLTMNGYGVRKSMFINFLKRVESLGKNIIFVAHEREEKDNETKIVRPDIGGSSAGDLIKELDLVGYMQAIGTERKIFWNPQEKFYAKNTCNLPSEQAIPVIISANGAVTGRNEFLANIFVSYSNYLEEQNKYKKQYADIISQIKSDVEGISDVDTANGIRKKVLEYPQLWDSKVVAERTIYDKCKSLGLKYNKAKNEYETAA